MADQTVGVLKAVLSADTAEFSRKMADASADVKKLAEKLQSDLEPRQRAVNAAVRDFLGGTEIRKAQEYAQAVEKIGGATVLTASDQLKVNKAVSDALEHYRKLGVEAPDNLRKLEAQTRASAASTDTLNVSFGKLVSSYVTGQAVIAGVEKGFDLVTGAITGSIKAASEAEKAHVQLVAALKAQGTAIPSVVDAYSHYATALQKTTIYQDDALEGAMALLVQIGNVMPKDMEKALEATTNLASGMGIDLTRAAEAVAKAAEGNVAGLKKMGVVIDEAKARHEGFGVVLDAITAKFGGQAAAIAGTYEGRIAQLTNTWNNVEESIGRVITTNETLLTLMGDVNREIDSNTGELNKNVTAANFVSDAVILAVKAFADLAAVLDVLQTGGSGFMITLRNMGSALGNIGIAALETAKAVTFLDGDATAAVDGMIDSLKASVKELGDRNEHTTQRSVELGQALDAIRSRAAVLTTQLEATRGRSVELNDATDKGTGAWNRQTTAVTDYTKAAAEAAKVAAYLLKEEQDKAKDRADVLKNLEAVAAQSAKNMADAFIANSKRERKEDEDRAKDHKAVIDKQIELAENYTRVIAKNLSAINRMSDDADTARDRRTLSSSQFQIAQINKWAADTKKAFIGTEQQAEQFYTQVDRFAREKIAAIGNAWAESFSEVGAGFAQLAQIAGGSMGELVRSIGTGVSAIGMLGRSMDTMNKGGGFASMASGLLGGFAAGISFVNMGAALVEALRKPGWKSLMEEIGQEWGIAISEGLAQAINSQAEKIALAAAPKGHGPTADYPEGRRIAELLNLDKIIKDAGGLTNASLDGWIDRANDLFDVIAKGGANGAAATKTLTSLLEMFGDQAVKAGGLWSHSFKDMIAQATALGIGLDQIHTLIEGQLSKAASATGGIVGGLTGTLVTPTKTLDGLNEQKQTFQEQTKSEDSDVAQKAVAGLKATEEEIAKVRGQVVAQSQADFDRLGRLTLASFNAYVANGHSALEAIQAIGPSIDQLKDATDKFGFAGSAAFDQLSRWRDLTEANAPLLDQVSGLNDLMSALSNIGSLDVATFQDIEAQGLSAFQGLTDAGFTQNEALTQMKPLLENIVRLHDENGLEIDDETQKLIDQARADGILKGRQIDTNHVLMEGLGKIITLLGGELPKAWDAAADSAENAADRVQTALDGIEVPSLTIPVSYETTGAPGGGYNGPDVTGSDATGFAGGTRGLRSFNPAGEWTKLHGREEVLNAGQSEGVASMVREALAGANGGGDSRGNVYLDSRLVGRALFTPIVREAARQQVTQR